MRSGYAPALYAAVVVVVVVVVALGAVCTLTATLVDSAEDVEILSTALTIFFADEVDAAAGEVDAAAALVVAKVSPK